MYPRGHRLTECWGLREPRGEGGRAQTRAPHPRPSRRRQLPVSWVLGASRRRFLIRRDALTHVSGLRPGPALKEPACVSVPRGPARACSLRRRLSGKEPFPPETASPGNLLRGWFPGLNNGAGMSLSLWHAGGCSRGPQAPARSSSSIGERSPALSLQPWARGSLHRNVPQFPRL